MNEAKITTVKNIYQESIAECGLACVCMLLNSFGKPIDIIHLRNKYRISASGLSFLDLKKILTDFGVEVMGLRIQIEDLVGVSRPCVAHINGNHFVVISNITDKSVNINDPETGKRKVTLAEFQKIYSGTVLAASPGQDFNKTSELSKLNPNFFFPSKTVLKKQLLILLAITLCIELSINATPLVIQHVIDHAIPKRDIQSVIHAIIVFLLLTIFLQASSVIRARFSEKIGLAIGARSSNSIFSHLLNLPLNYFEQRSVGDIQSRFSAISRIRMFLTGNSISVVLDTFFSILVLCVLFIYSIPLAMVSLAFLCLFLSIKVVRYYRHNRYLEGAEMDYADADTFFLESIRGIVGIKIFSGAFQRTRRWCYKMDHIHKQQIKNAFDEVNFSTGANLMLGLEKVVILYMGAEAVIGDVISLGQFLAYMAYKEQLYWRAVNLSNNIAAFHFLKISIRRLKDITATPAPAVFVGPFGPKSKSGMLSVNHVSYSYSDFEKNILNELSFDIRIGKHTVIVGPSGLGKSTLAKLILGLDRPTKGSVTINGTDVSCSGYHIVGVMQGDRLLSGTIKDNIVMFCDVNDPERLNRCMAAACVLEIIEGLKLGLDTQVGDMGSCLSGGQIQRILIARALYAEPDILVLDEATSHLDAKTEERVSQNIANLAITRISFSHRSQTIKSADCVFDLNTKEYV